MAEQTDTESLAGKDRWQLAIQLGLGDVCLLSCAVSMVLLVFLVLLTTFTGIWQFSVLWPICPIIVVALHYYSKRRNSAKWTLLEKFAVVLIGPTAIVNQHAPVSSPAEEAADRTTAWDAEKPLVVQEFETNAENMTEALSRLDYVKFHLMIKLVGALNAAEVEKAVSDTMFAVVQFSGSDPKRASQMLKQVDEFIAGGEMFVFVDGERLYKPKAKILADATLEDRPAVQGKSPHIS
jgi:hypothetical protein